MRGFVSKLNHLIISVLGAENHILSLTVILPKVFNPGMLRDCYRTASFSDFRSAFS